MRKIILAIILALLVMPLVGSYRFSQAFLTTAVSCAKSTTVVNGVGFTSANVNIMTQWSTGSITVTFTRAAGTVETVDFEFQTSYDGGTTYSTAYYVRIRVPTNETAVTNAVRVTKEVNFYGVSHIRLYRIVNNDTVNDLTVCNATVTF